MRLFGLIGYPLEHSFSKKYFTEKFEREGITDACYELYPLPDIVRLPTLWKSTPDLRGLNVTIPYKQAVQPFLTALDETAQAVGAVNVIRILGETRTGYNTDVIGFEKSLLAWLQQVGLVQHAPGEAVHFLRPLQTYVIGTGGASKAVAYILTKHRLPFYTVSRTPRQDAGQLAYEDLENAFDTAYSRLWINTTPVGTFPNVEAMPPLPVERFNRHDFVYDLIYNPSETLLMRTAAAQGAATHNGLAMLYGQAEAAWDIWNNLIFTPSTTRLRDKHI